MNDADGKSLFSVEGMVVLITGGATGIGLMMTKAFAHNGAAKVYIVGRRKDKLDEAAALSPNIVPIVGDVTCKDSLRQAAAHVKRETGHLNLLCCNSGYMPPPIGVKTSDVSVHEYAQQALLQDPEDWNRTFATNTTSIFFTAMAFLELLDTGNSGTDRLPGRKSQILVTSSIAGFLRNPGNLGAYPASKAAATHMVKHLSSALVPYSIRVNGLAPGLFPSELAEGMISQAGGVAGRDPTEKGAFDRMVIPGERLGRTGDVVGTVLYLASAAGAYVNGNVLVLDSGRIGVMHGTY